MFNHIEYDTTSLADEFERDSQKSDSPIRPENYFPNDDATRQPVNRWRAHAHLLFGNWINEMYQTTPFDLTKIGE
jgi:homoserine O-succinyltransferase